MQEALLAAFRQWPADGMPENRHVVRRGWAARLPHLRSLPSHERRSSSPHDLIRCDRPPVGEVALTLQFPGDVVDLDVLAGFVSAVRSEFPRTERQPHRPSHAGAVRPAAASASFEITLEPANALPRTWLISRDETRLIQLQGDRISLNWRRPDDAVKYPRYTTLRRDLRLYFKTLGRCFEETGRKAPTVDLAEVTYVNPIEPPGPARGGGHPELAKVLTRVRPRPRKAYIMTLVGRVIPPGNGERAAWRALDTAYKRVVLGFKELTTREMQDLWGLREKG